MMTTLNTAAFAKLPNGTYTLRNIESGDHRTVRVRTQPEDSTFAPGERVVSLLTGPDNTRDFDGFAFLKDGDRLAVWARYHGTQAEKIGRLLLDMTIGEGARWGRLYEIDVARQCVRCNRTLTTPASIQAGIGPKCAEMMR